MRDQTIISPYFLDELEPDMIALGPPDRAVVMLDLPAGERTARMGAIYDALAGQVHETLVAGKRPVVFAGDCCATIGVLAGLQRAGLEPSLLWFDAHGDFNTWETTPSGFLGGMPLAMAVGLGEQTLLTATGMHPWPTDKVTLIDGRDLDPGERDNVREAAIGHVPDVARLLEPGALPDGPLYVHFDVDVIDPAEAPAMNYPAPGGPSAAQVNRVLAALAATGRVIAVSVSLWEPSLDGDGRTERVGQAAIASLLGRS